MGDVGDEPEHGRRRQCRKRGFATQGDASAGLDEARRAIEVEDHLFDLEHIAFIECLDPWLDDLANTSKTPLTIADYRNETRRYVRPHMPEVKLANLTPLHLEHLYRTLVKQGGRKGQPLSPKTVRRVHQMIQKALTDAERKGIVQRNAARLTDKPSTAQLETNRISWTPDELRTLLTAAEDHELFPLIRLTALTGMRRGEVCGLKWEDLDLAGMQLRVRRTLGVVDGKPVLGTPKSRRSRRTIDLDKRTVKRLRAHREHEAEAVELVGAGWHHSGYVFTTVIGTHTYPDNVGKRFTDIVRTTDVPYLTLHGLRHTHATHLLAMGQNPRMVSERLGHADVAFTLQVYGHVLPGRQREAADAAARLVG